MLILAVETSGTTAGVALLAGDAATAISMASAEGTRHARSLIRDVETALQSAGYRPWDVDVVGASIGPGSFTGLRVGVVFAKTWCYATGARLVAVDTLLAAAANSPAGIGRVYAVADAQRGDLYAGEYRRDERGAFERIGDIAIVNAGEFAAARDKDDFITGPGLDRYAGLFDGKCRIASPTQRHPTASAVAELARRSAEAGDFTDFWTLEPFYVRKSAAEEKWDAKTTE